MSNAANVRVGVTGALFGGPVGTAAPTATNVAPDAAFKDYGFLGEDGVEFQLPGAGDATPIKAWQDGTTVRIIRTPSDDVPTYHLTFLETSIETIEATFGVQVTSTATEGSFEYTVTTRDHMAFVLDVIDGASIQRDHIPYGIVTEVGAITYANTTAKSYEVTIAADLDPTTGYNFKRLDTALKTAA